MLPVTRSDETVLKWVKSGYYWTSKVYYFFAKTLIEEYGPEKAKELFIKQIYNMGKQMGEKNRAYLESEGRPVDLEERFSGGNDDNSIYNFAWKSRNKNVTKNEVIVEWLECPFAEGFKAYGEEGVGIGEWFCEHIDNAVSKGFGPENACVRETSIYKDEVCTLHFTHKE